MLSKLREEAAARRNEVEYYQRALSSLIRDKTLPSIVMSPTQIKRSVSATPKKLEKSISVKSEKRQHLLTNNTTVEKVKSDSKKTLKPIKKAVSTSFQTSTQFENQTNHEEVESKSRARVERSEKRVKSAKNGKIIPTENSFKQPVKRVNHLMNYEETESSAKSPDLLTPAESGEEEKGKHVEKKKRSHDASSVGSRVTNGEYDNDSNIGALNAEYQEKEMEDRLSSLITALRCQLLREEMIQTRVMSF
uniref:Uncharacterized protein n=1 Tax=Panagrolaimus sp. ES5 TaxID=591445 RepID=A0AC34FTR5_9BILA